MGKDFTFSRVRLFAKAYANYLHRTIPHKEIAVLINYDTRYLSREYAYETAKILSLNRIGVRLPLRDLPAPAASLAIGQNQLQGGISFTASFNELIFNGIKVFDSRGWPALPSLTLMIEKEIQTLADHYRFKPNYAVESLIASLDPQPAYLDYLKKTVDLSSIKNAGLHIIVDNLYGTSRDYLDRFLSENGVNIVAIHNFIDPNFGDVIPSCNRFYLKELAQQVTARKADIGLSTDIDSDRFGIIDEAGNFLDSNTITPVLIEYLITVRKMTGGIVKSLSTTESINQVAGHYSRKVYETPVGFKYLADMLGSREAFLAAESSNGAALKGPIHMKDGILFNLLVTEMVASYRQPIHRILKNFFCRFPRRYQREIQLPTTPLRKEKYIRLLEQRELNTPGIKPLKTITIDGIKFLFDSGWLLIRESGTKNAIRIYSESVSRSQAAEFIKLGRALVG